MKAEAFLTHPEGDIRYLFTKQSPLILMQGASETGKSVLGMEFVEQALKKNLNAIVVSYRGEADEKLKKRLNLQYSKQVSYIEPCREENGKFDFNILPQIKNGIIFIDDVFLSSKVDDLVKYCINNKTVIIIAHQDFTQPYESDNFDAVMKALIGSAGLIVDCGTRPGYFPLSGCIAGEYTERDKSWLQGGLNPYRFTVFDGQVRRHYEHVRRY
ncbi:hypothetical protein [Neptuniibacter sp. QD37_11]|uniref:hypothetical protein n=1 Tax=Neptuniibacter sp. QD37_11 TaxID=3398209 RepID=UPI0039F49726